MRKTLLCGLFVVLVCSFGLAQINQPGGGGLGGSLPTGGNPGPVPYVSTANTLSEDANNICWDATNHRLGIGNVSGTCAPAGGVDLDVEFASGSQHQIRINNNTSGVGAALQLSGQGLTQMIMEAAPTGSCSSLGSCGLLLTGTSAPIIMAPNGVNKAFIQTTGEVDIGTPTAAGAAILLSVAGDAKRFHSIAGGTAPTIASGAGTGATIAGADESGTITVGTTPGNSIVVNLGQSYTNVPTCSATDTSASPVFVQCVGATGTLTLNGIAFSTGAAANFTASHVITWIVGGH